MTIVAATRERQIRPRPVSRAAFVMGESGDYHIMISETDDETVVYVRGDIDLTTHDTLVRMLDDAASRGQNVIVDLSRTTFMDSSGLQALLELWHSQTAAGLKLVLRDPTDPILQTLHYAGLDRVFRIDRQSQPGS